MLNRLWEIKDNLARLIKQRRNENESYRKFKRFNHIPKSK